MNDYINNHKTSELRENVTFDKFKNAYLKFIEQAKDNAKTGKSKGMKTPNGFSDKCNFDGDDFKQSFGQGAASKAPYVNWGVVSIYYIVETGSIILGIEKNRYPAVQNINVEQSASRRIGNKTDDVAVFYEATIDTVNYEELYECFLKVCEEVIRLGLHYKNGNDNHIKKNTIKTGGENTMKNENTEKNLILYGPPGTGKTYNTVCYAVAICEGKKIEDIIAEAKNDYSSVKGRYDKLKNNGRIEFTTFHQSYGYEEFIEGIRPVTRDDGSVAYEIQDGIFKEFALCAKRNYDDSQKSKEAIKQEIVVQDAIDAFFSDVEIGQDKFKTLRGSEFHITSFDEQYIYISIPQNQSVDKVRLSIAEIRSMLESDRRFEKISDITSFVGIKTTQQRFSYDLVLYNEILKRKRDMSVEATTVQELKNYVFIIDEINRGNISKIFGELITLIEPSKRLGQPEELCSILPYSKKPFGVPDNVYIIGTMNTADRSIATIDTALRRRFSFKEMLPDTKILSGIEVDKINIENMLESMNNKISVLFDREHTIGHAYFMSLKDNPTIETLANIFKNNIIPLLQEYFYEDYEKIRLVLGDNKKQDETQQFIKTISNDYSTLFGGDIDFDVSCRYEINESAFNMPEAYKYI